MSNCYDEIGKGYTNLRVPDGRIASLIHNALGNVKTIANVGAGTGSYEPINREVIAIDPSWLMLQQYKGHGNRIQGTAESLPLSNHAVDASMGILTLHHWKDWKQGLSEMFRASRKVVVLLTHKPDLYNFWLLDYFPAIQKIDHGIFPAIDKIEKEAWDNHWNVTTLTVPVPHDCTDGFLGAYWRRPEAYFRADVRRSISTFNLLDANLVQQTLMKLRRDLDSGSWDDKYGHLYDLAELDIGYRILRMTPATAMDEQSAD